MATYVYDEKKYNAILEYLTQDDIYKQLDKFERQMLGSCLVMNDKRIALSAKQRPIIERIWRKYQRD